MTLRVLIPAGLALWTALTATGASAAVETLVSRTIERTTLVIDGDDLRHGRLPGRLVGRELPPVDTNAVRLACLPLASRPGALLVYVPEVKACDRIVALPRNDQRRVESLHGAMNDAAPEGRVLVLQPAPAATALSCTCPPGPPESSPLILKNGFELPL